MHHKKRLQRPLTKTCAYVLAQVNFMAGSDDLHCRIYVDKNSVHVHTHVCKPCPQSEADIRSYNFTCMKVIGMPPHPIRISLENAEL